MTIRPLTAADVPVVETLIDAALGGRMQARRGELVDVLLGCEGLLAIDAGGNPPARPVGIVTWFIEPGGDGVAEVRAVAVAPDARGAGTGRALMNAAAAALRARGVTRAWLVTTNDNLSALALYQKAGWRLAALREGALDEARRTLKRSIPEMGEHGIPLRDELQLELKL